MKKIDIKSALIGVFFTTTVIFSLGATGKKDQGQWDAEQQWEFIIPPSTISSDITRFPHIGFCNFYDSSIPLRPGRPVHSVLIKKGWEPIDVRDGGVLLRKRVN